MKISKLRKVADHISILIGWRLMVMTVAEVGEAGILDPPCPLAIFYFGPFEFMLDVEGVIMFDAEDGRVDISKPPLDIAKDVERIKNLDKENGK